MPGLTYIADYKTLGYAEYISYNLSYSTIELEFVEDPGGQHHCSGAP